MVQQTELCVQQMATVKNKKAETIFSVFFSGCWWCLRGSAAAAVLPCMHQPLSDDPSGYLQPLRRIKHIYSFLGFFFNKLVPALQHGACSEDVIRHNRNPASFVKCKRGPRQGTERLFTRQTKAGMFS